MFLTEMKALLRSLKGHRSTFRFLFFVFIVTHSGQCVPRTERTQNEEFKRRGAHQHQLGAVFGDNALGADFPPKNRVVHPHNVLDHPEDRLKRDRNYKNLPLPPLFEKRGKHLGWGDGEAAAGKDKEDWGDGFADSNWRREPLHFPKSHGLFVQPGKRHPQRDDPEPRLDTILNDVKPPKATGSETVVDYYFVDDAAEPHHLGLPKHGVIINLRGLIPAEDEEEEEDEEEDDVIAEPASHDGPKMDEVLAFKAFEISPSPAAGDPGRSQSQSDDQFAEEAIDAKGPKTPQLESRNLSRKRRQKSSPNQEDADRRRRGYFRRRRRKRKRRQRHSKAGEDAEDLKIRGAEVLQDDRYLLRSNSPAYVITSANEVKKDWCRTVPLKQKIVEPHCKPRVLMNNFCYGQCNSFFIPHNSRTGSGAAFQSCAFCKPHRSKWTTVTLHCPGLTPPRREKRILMVESCRCKTEILQSA